MLNGPLDETIGTVLLSAADTASSEEAAKFLVHLGYRIAEGTSVPDLVVQITGAAELAPPEVATQGEYPPPMVVFGPPGAGEWRKRALEQGAFACMSLDAPIEERASLLAAASRYREAQKQVRTVREESNEIITHLLTTYGEETERHHTAVEERKEAQASLDRIQRRIIRSIL